MPQSYKDLVAQRDALISKLPVGNTERRQRVLDAWEFSESPDDFLSQIADIPGSDDVKRQLASTWNTAYTYVTAPSQYAAMGEAGAAPSDIGGVEQVSGGYTLPAVIARPKSVIRELPGQAITIDAAGNISAPAVKKTAEDIANMATALYESGARGISNLEPLPDTWQNEVIQQIARSQPMIPMTPATRPAMAAGLEMLGDVASGIQQQTAREYEAAKAAPDVMGKVRGAVRTIPAVGPMIEETVAGLMSPSPERAAETIAKSSADIAVPFAGGKLAKGLAKGGKALTMSDPVQAAMEVMGVKKLPSEMLAVRAVGSPIAKGGSRRLMYQMQDVGENVPNVNAGLQREGIDLNKPFVDRELGGIEITPDTPGGTLRAYVIGAESQLDYLWDKISQMIKSGDINTSNANGRMIANEIRKAIPEDVVTSIRSGAPTVRAREIWEAAQERIAAYENAGVVSPDTIRANIKTNNRALDQFYRSGTEEVNAAPSIKAALAEQDALKRSLELAIDDKSLSDATRKALRQYGSLSEFRDALNKRFGQIVTKQGFDLGQGVAAMSAGRSFVRGAAVALSNPKEAIQYGLEGISAYSVPQAMRKAFSADQLLKELSSRYKAAPDIMVMPPKVAGSVEIKEAVGRRASILTEAPAVADARRALDIAVASGDEAAIARADAALQLMQQKYGALSEQGRSLTRAGVGTGDVSQMPPTQAPAPRMLTAPTAASASDVIRRRQAELARAVDRLQNATTKQDKAEAAQALSALQQQYLVEGAISDRPIITPPPADTSFVRGVVEPWSQMEAKTGIPVRLPTGESVVIIGRNPQTGLTRFRYLVPGREGEIGEAYLNLPMPAPRESLVSPIIIPKKR